MKMTKIVSITVASLLCIFFPIASLFITVLAIPPQYENSFSGALDEKFERLTEIEGEKIVVVGGSSVAFGLNSEILEEHLKMPVVNFGLYAALGTKVMLDLSRAGIGRGDIVILAPELDRQTMSLYFSSEHTLEALDGNYGMARYIAKDNRLALVGGLWRHAQKKLRDSRLEPIDPRGVYNAKNFNERGDVVWERPENVMPLYYDKNAEISLTPDIVSEDFIDYLNEYIGFCKSRGATVYFSYSPMNELALAAETTDESKELFTNFLKERLDCEIISVLDSYIMDAGYFYDTNFHLNDAGVLYRTRMLIEDLMIAEGRISAITLEAPPPPALPAIDSVYSGSDENEKYFTYERLDGGGMMITGLTDEGRAAASLTVPLGAEGYKVTHLGSLSLSEASAAELIITADTNLREMLGSPFDGSSIRDIWIYYDFERESEQLSPAVSFGPVERIHIPAGSAYTGDYDWVDQPGLSGKFVIIPKQ